ncbi:hypothetical protein FM037_00765 [Shewanella psychropiezotolerans]|uniref:Uncharacterized protein n=1 Tax=Shewanella psychropiezotolerans TaxID=2593655 RepID=A0ABX5WUH1_9GAMM|nr:MULTISPECIES: hypothetical protein [Shewanella]MPY25352.1 hypothetical protein [Shewanella sp. YLB-07]QDO82022.1 hypothetical protein FM037_00765 [Shewanella psychropiezotolerans]
MKSTLMIMVLSMLFITLNSNAQDRQTEIYLYETATSVDIKISASLFGEELTFKDQKHDITIRNMGEDTFDVDAKFFRHSIESLPGSETGAEPEFAFSNQIMTSLKLVPHEKVILGGIESWSSNTQEDGTVTETQSKKVFTLERLD